MAATPSNMFPLGEEAPAFSLRDTVSGDYISLADAKGEKATVVMFICNHCPFVIHVAQQIAVLATDYQAKGIGFVAISSNDVVKYPQDAPGHMKTFASGHGLTFPYLYDESQDVAKAYQAACTPDFYVFDAGLRCAYRGQLDGARPGNKIPVTGGDIRKALDCLIGGKPVPGEQYPSIGCNIKWK